MQLVHKGDRYPPKTAGMTNIHYPFFPSFQKIRLENARIGVGRDEKGVVYGIKAFYLYTRTLKNAPRLYRRGV